MSYHGYLVSLELVKNDPPFYALIMAAMRKADTDNTEKLKKAWPDVWEELYRRYHSMVGPGLLEGERLPSGELVVNSQTGEIRE